MLRKKNYCNASIASSNLISKIFDFIAGNQLHSPITIAWWPLSSLGQSIKWNASHLKNIKNNSSKNIFAKALEIERLLHSPNI